MKSKSLAGYSYSITEGKAARDAGQLLALRIETSLLCNMRCIYCAWNSGEALDNEIDYSVLKRFVNEGKALGAKSVIIVGGGEPTIYKDFKNLVTYISELKMIPVVITNGMTIDMEMAKFLYNSNCSVLIKCDSLKPSTQDYLSGIPGAFKRMNIGLQNLIDCGFNQTTDKDQLRLGISFIVTSLNIDEIPDIWRFARKNNLYPNMEILNSIGRSSTNITELFTDKHQLDMVLDRILKIDETEFGIQAVRGSTHSNHCLQHLYSVYLNVQGYVQPCGAIRIKAYNFNDANLVSILNNNYFCNARKQENHLDENVELTSYFF